MKVFRIRQSIAHFDQWKPLILKMPFKLKSNGQPLRLLRFRGHFRGHWGQNFKIIQFLSLFIIEFLSFNRIFVVLNFEVVWPRQPRLPRKEHSDYFQRLHFWNQFVSLIKMHYRVRCLLDFDLKIPSSQVCKPSCLGQAAQALTLVILSFNPCSKTQNSLIAPSTV